MSRAARLLLIYLVLPPNPAGAIECVDFPRMHGLLRRAGTVCHGAVQSGYRGHGQAVLRATRFEDRCAGDASWFRGVRSIGIGAGPSGRLLLDRAPVPNGRALGNQGSAVRWFERSTNDLFPKCVSSTADRPLINIGYLEQPFCFPPRLSEKRCAKHLTGVQIPI